MKPWNNHPLIAYHGSSLNALSRYSINKDQPLKSFKVDLDKCMPLTDFGRGFYVTTNLKQAKNWANKRSSIGKNDRAVVLKFAIDRNWLASIHNMFFSRDCDDYWSLVKHCRTGGSPHNRSGKQNEYDYVVGPVSYWDQIEVIHDCDQLSFHSETSCSQLPIPTVELIASSYRKGKLFIK